MLYINRAGPGGRAFLHNLDCTGADSHVPMITCTYHFEMMQGILVKILEKVSGYYGGESIPIYMLYFVCMTSINLWKNNRLVPAVVAVLSCCLFHPCCLLGASGGVGYWGDGVGALLMVGG